MPYIDGTRTATLAMDHTQDRALTLINPIGIAIPPTWEDQYLDKGTPFTFSGHLGFSGQIAFSDYTYGINSTTWGWELRAIVTVVNGHGATQTTTVTVGTGTSTAYFANATATYAGSFSASVGVDKLWDIAEAAFSSSSATKRLILLRTYRPCLVARNVCRSSTWSCRLPKRWQA